MEQPASPAPIRPKHKRHSILGGISLIAGVLSVSASCLALIGVLAILFIHYGRADTTGLQTTIGELCGLGNGLLALGGLVSGLAGFFERDRDRIPNILGILLCGVSLLMLGILLLLGGVGGGGPSLPSV